MKKNTLQTVPKPSQTSDRPGEISRRLPRHSTLLQQASQKAATDLPGPFHHRNLFYGQSMRASVSFFLPSFGEVASTFCWFCSIVHAGKLTLSDDVAFVATFLVGGTPKRFKGDEFSRTKAAESNRLADAASNAKMNDRKTIQPYGGACLAHSRKAATFKNTGTPRSFDSQVENIHACCRLQKARAQFGSRLL